MVADPATSRRYAQAYVNALEGPRRLGQVEAPPRPSGQHLEQGLSELTFICETYQASKELERFLGSPEIASSEKWTLLSKLFSELAGAETMGLLHLLLRWDRVDHLPLIAQEAKLLAETRAGVLRGIVTTAHPISSSELGALSQGLGKLLGKQVVLERQMDPALMGGLRISVGTLLLDGSVQRLLQKIRRHLLQTKGSSP